jgi:hypothetical protein
MGTQCSFASALALDDFATAVLPCMSFASISVNIKGMDDDPWPGWRECGFSSADGTLLMIAARNAAKMTICAGVVQW